MASTVSVLAPDGRKLSLPFPGNIGTLPFARAPAMALISRLTISGGRRKKNGREPILHRSASAVHRWARRRGNRGGSQGTACRSRLRQRGEFRRPGILSERRSRRGAGCLLCQSVPLESPRCAGFRRHCRACRFRCILSAISLKASMGKPRSASALTRSCFRGAVRAPISEYIKTVTVDRVLAIAMGEREPLLDPAVGRKCPGDGGRSRNPLVERRQKKGRHPTAGPPCGADAFAVEVWPAGEIINRPARIQQLRRQRRVAAAVPVKPGVGIDAVVRRLDLARLDVIHHQGGDAVRRKPGAMMSIFAFAGWPH